MKCYFVYILASCKNGTLYIGVSNDLYRRVQEHKHGLVEGFSKKYHTHKLVYFQQFKDVRNAIAREKQLKKWNRAWKIRLVEETNPDWDDLFYHYCPTQETGFPPTRE